MSNGVDTPGAGIGEPESPQAGARPRVLVVEDSPTQADWLAQVLATEGYQVQVATSGREAIRGIRSGVDLVLLDMILPDMDGLALLRIIKSRSEEQFIPVILLSVKADLESRVKGLRIGADDFLAKPFADVEILARAAAMLRIKSLQDQLQLAKAQLEKLSLTDALTGLYNRRHFEQRLSEEVRRSQRYSDPVSLMMLDLDHFKAVNDRYGHQVGDRVLRDTAKIIASSVRDTDICARYGGEEFAVILPKTDLQGALSVGERFVRLVRQKQHVVEGEDPARSGTLRVTASVGIAIHPSKDVLSPDLLVKYADEALYRAKAEGRDTICFYQAQVYRYDLGAA